MKIRNINKNQQSFSGAFACVNGEWITLTRGGQKVATKAVKRNVEEHSLDFFVRNYSKDAYGRVYVVKNKEFNSFFRKNFNEFKKTLDLDVNRYIADLNKYVNYHRIEASKEQPTRTYLILTGKEAVQLKTLNNKDERGQFIRELFGKVNIDIDEKRQIKFNYASGMPKVPTPEFREKHGAAWMEALRANLFIADAKKDANVQKRLAAMA